MTGSQIFVLIFMLGGVIAMGIFLMGLGFYYRGKNSGGSGKQDGDK